MNEPTPTASEISRIEAALDNILSAITHLDQGIWAPGKPRAKSAAYRIYSMADLGAEYELKQTYTVSQRYAEDILDNPVREVLAKSVRQLGKRLHEIGGLNAMQEACERVANIDEPNWGRRTNIMDKRWDGIGNWVA